LVASLVKRILLGRPLASDEQAGQRVGKLVALPTFSADAISSTAYATEQILVVVAAGGSSLALGLSKLVPISLVVAGLLVVVVSSYRQTIFAYPSGGGSYIVSRENLGRYPSLIAAASLLIDYVLTASRPSCRSQHYVDSRRSAWSWDWWQSPSSRSPTSAASNSPGHFSPYPPTPTSRR
jgi:hypothetical protein